MRLFSQVVMVLRVTHGREFNRTIILQNSYFTFLILNPTGPKPQACWSYKNIVYQKGLNQEAETTK